MVEKTETPDMQSIGKDRFDSALIQTSTEEGIYVKRTGGIDSTVQFIISLSQSIANQFSGKPIRALSMLHPINKQEYLSRLDALTRNNSEIYHQTLPCYAAINSKSANLTCRDIFLKQLLAIRHLTPEKAILIADKFCSIRDLYRHYLLLNPEEGENYFKNWEAQSGRKFGPALAKRIYQIFTQPKYTDTSTPFND